jgi:hypothetical protein
MSFRDAVLPMRVHTAKRLRLMLSLAIVSEQVVGEPSVIGMIVSDWLSHRVNQQMPQMLASL